ncbi:hypothetical protein JCM8208_004515 [Rhodotorula glutinis]
MLPLERKARYGRLGAPAPYSDSDEDDDRDDSCFDCRSAFDAEPPAVKMLTTVFIRAIPVLATVSWLGTLLALLGLWTFQDGRARYQQSDGSLSSIASVGAAHRLTFLSGSISTAIFYVLSLVTERFLRTTRVLTEATDERPLWVAVGCVDVLVGLGAAASLILLAVFDTVEFPHEHDILLIAFFVCVVVSGLLQTTEVEHLWHEHPDRDDLREGAFLKLVFLTVVAVSGLGFWILKTLCKGDATSVPYERCYRLVTASATLQWLSALFLAAYLATLILDLWPIGRHTRRARSARGWAAGEGERERERDDGEAWGEGEGKGEGRGARKRLEAIQGRGASVVPPALAVDSDDARRDGDERAELLVELGRRATRRAARTRRSKHEGGGRAKQ